MPLLAAREVLAQQDKNNTLTTLLQSNNISLAHLSIQTSTETASAPDTTVSSDKILIYFWRERSYTLN